MLSNASRLARSSLSARNSGARSTSLKILKTSLKSSLRHEREIVLESSLGPRFSLCTSVGACSRFDDAHRAVRRNEYLIGHAPNISFANCVNSINRAEELAPVTIKCLVHREILCKSFIAVEAANQICFGSFLHH